MKRILVFLLSVLPLLAQYHGLQFGHPITSAAVSTAAMNAAANWLAFPLVVSSNRTLNEFVFRSGTVTGTMNAADLRVEVIMPVGSVPGATVTFTDGSDIVNLTGHPFANGDTVAFSNTGGALPTGIANYTTLYYVCNANANDFQIDDDSGCASLVTDFSSASGTNMVRKVILVDQADGALSSNTHVTCTLTNTALTAGTYYMVLVMNVAGTPASNNFVFNYMASQAPFAGGYGPSGLSLGQTVNSGSTFSTSVFNAGGWRFGFGDGGYIGYPAYAPQQAGTSDRPNAANEVGNRIVLPSNFTLPIIGIGFCGDKLGTPTTTSFRMRVYTGSNGAESLADTSDTLIPPTNMVATTTIGCIAGYFTSPVNLSGTVRVMIGSSSGSDTTGNTFRPIEGLIHDSAASKALVMNGIQHAKFDGTSTWTYTDTKFASFWLIPSTTFPASGGSSVSVGVPIR